MYSVSSEAGILVGLDGAIQRLIINGEAQVNLQRRALSSSQVRDYLGFPCDPRASPQCDNGGTCVPWFRKPVCACPPGFRGKHCRQRDKG